MLSVIESSRACEPCRKRKVKCDRGLPACTKCLTNARDRRECFYRQNRFDLMLHDETKTTRKRYERRPQESYPFQHAQLFLVQKACKVKSPIRFAQRIDVSKPVFTDLAVQAGRNILLTIFEHGVYYQYLPAIYSSFPTSNLLEVAVETVGLRCLSLARNEGRLMLKARENHAAALQIANQRISCLTNSLTPYDTVASVMLLALFAVMSSDSLTARRVWTKHVDGALAILISWQSQQNSVHIATPAIQALLGHIINCVQLSYLQQQKCLPIEVHMIYDLLPQNNVQARLHTIINGLTDLPMGLPHSGKNVSAYVQQLCKLDEDIAVILQFLESSQPFKVVSNHTGQLNEPICHKYYSHRSAQVWNLVRVLRLLVNEKLLILLSGEAQPYHSSENAGIWLPLDLQNCRRQLFPTISSVTFDIYASVPLWLRRRIHTASDYENHHDPVNDDRVHWAHSLIWPLAIVQASPYTSKTLLTLIDDTLRSLWQATTFPGAIGPEKQQAEGLDLKNWAHIFFWC